jgi:transcriptional regulator with XRE-family HTH domain
MPRETAALAELRRELGERLATFRQAAGLTQGELAAATNRDRTAVTHLEKGRVGADERFWQRADDECRAGGALVAAFHQFEAARQAHEEQQRRAELAKHQSKASSYGLVAASSWQPEVGSEADETAALELLRRITASDVGNETLTRLELVVDDLAVAYSVTPPAELLVRVRQYLAYVMGLMDARKTLAEHRRLLVVAGWLSLLAATVHIDLNQPVAATARLRTAASLAHHAEQPEIRAWCYETEAWRVLTEGDYRRALDLSRQAQAFAPAGSSIAIQATAQEGRAQARLGNAHETYGAIDRVHRLVAPLDMPDRPEHHYRYDPTKSVAYTATTLAWLGDPAAESFAREIIARLQPAEDVGKWPRRVAAANLDLALTLLVTDRLDEACDATQRAIASGRVVPSNHWRAAEVVEAVEARQLPEAGDLREAYEVLRRD